MDNIVLIALITGILSVSINIVLKRFDVPPIIGYIFSGAIIATALGLGGGSHTLEHIAEFGIVFLMFTIGLEIKLENLIQMKKQVFTYGGLQVGLVMVIFTALAYYLFDFDVKSSLVIGSALSLSSTAIVLKILNDTNEISKPYGENTLGILIFQDLAVIPLLLMITILSDSTSTISSMIIDIVVAGVLLLVVMVIFGKYFLDYILKIVDRSDTHELFIMVVLVIAIGSSYLAHAFGFTYSLGAFIGGMLIAETHYKHQIEADLIPFRDLFLALFFVTVGMQIDLGFFVSNIVDVFGLSLIIMIVKASIIFAIIYIFSTKPIALKTALAISQVGEFSFVIFTQATQTNLLDKSVGQLLTLSVIVSMILTPFILKKIPAIVNLVFRKTELDTQSTVKKEILEDHTIVCGYGSFGKKIINNLKEYDINYITIIDNYDFFEKAIEHDEHAIFGNPAQKNILLEAGIKKAKVVIIAVHDVEHISIIYHAITSVNKDVKIIAKVTNKHVFDSSVNTDDFVDVYNFSASIIATNTLSYINNVNKD